MGKKIQFGRAIGLRLSPSLREDLTKIAESRSRTQGKKVTVTDVIRGYIEDGLKSVGQSTPS